MEYKQKSRNSLNTKKYPTGKQRSEGTQVFTKAKDLQTILDCTLKPISKLLKNISAHAFCPPGAKIPSSKAKHSDVFKPTPLKQHLKLYFHSLKQISLKEGTLKLSFQQLAEITFEERKPALQQKRRQNTRILSFVTQYRPSVPNLKQIQMQILNNHCLAEY